MSETKRAADNAIRELAARPAVFSAHEVAVCADMPGGGPAVTSALRAHCWRQNIAPLGGNFRAGAWTPRRYYVGRAPALRWWCGHSVRLAQLGIDRLAPAQLQSAMALAFDRRRWNALPDGLLDIGRQTGMVADGCAPGELVFPWAAVLQTNPACVDAFRLMFAQQSPPDDIKGLTLDTVVDKVLRRLSARECDVMRKRYGLDGGALTLAQVGGEYGVTRERVRQIQSRALNKLASANFQRGLWWAFVGDFMMLGCSLVMPDSRLTPKRKFLHKIIGLNTAAVPEFNLRIIGPVDSIAAYRESLRDDSIGEPAADALAFLSKRDREALRIAEQERNEQRAAKNMARMIQKCLRALGRAAHYTEIAAQCDALFPQNRKSAHNWHAALARLAARETLGIVWIGAHGKYALKEHGYSRPAEKLYDAVARIVREKFAETRRPVPRDAVLTELGKRRREYNRNSVLMALAFSDDIERVDGGYVPRSAPKEQTTTQPAFDIAAAMRVFSASHRET